MHSLSLTAPAEDKDMRNIHKLTLALAMLVGANPSWAQDGELLVSTYDKGGAMKMVFELLNEGNVAGVSFDIVFVESVAAENIQMGNCVGVNKSSQLAGCNLLNKTTLRVGIIDPQLGELPTGELGHVFVKGLGSAEFSVQNARLVTSKGIEREVDALTDAGNSRFEKPMQSR
jgi:hypothetical protein